MSDTKSIRNDTINNERLWTFLCNKLYIVNYEIILTPGWKKYAQIYILKHKNSHYRQIHLR